MGTDARRLNSTDQEALRFRALAELDRGIPKTVVAGRLGVSRRSLINWSKARNHLGVEGLQSKSRGRPLGTGLLTWSLEKAVRRQLASGYLANWGEYALWTVSGVYVACSARDIICSKRSVRQWLKSWGIAPTPLWERPTAIGRRDAELAAYKALRTEAKRVRATVVWLDDSRMLSFRLARRLPDLAARKVHWDLAQEVLLAYTNARRMYFGIVREAYTSRVVLDFLARLIEAVGAPLFVCVRASAVSVFETRQVQRWLRRHRAQLTVFRVGSFTPLLEQPKSQRNSAGRAERKERMSESRSMSDTASARVKGGSKVGSQRPHTPGPSERYLEVDKGRRIRREETLKRTRKLSIHDVYEDALLALDVMYGAVKNRARWNGAQMPLVRRYVGELLRKVNGIRSLVYKNKPQVARRKYRSR